MAVAVLLVGAHDEADRRQRVVVEEQSPGLPQATVQEELHGLRYRGRDRACLAALRDFALEAPFGLFFDLDTCCSLGLALLGALPVRRW